MNAKYKHPRLVNDVLIWILLVPLLIAGGVIGLQRPQAAKPLMTTAVRFPSEHIWSPMPAIVDEASHPHTAQSMWSVQVSSLTVGENRLLLSRAPLFGTFPLRSFLDSTGCSLAIGMEEYKLSTEPRWALSLPSMLRRSPIRTMVLSLFQASLQGRLGSLAPLTLRWSMTPKRALSHYVS